MSLLQPGEMKRYLVGTITANGTSAVTITIPGIAADSLVLVSLRTVGGTTAPVYEDTRNLTTGAVGFKSTAGNTSIYNVYAFV